MLKKMFIGATSSCGAILGSQVAPAYAAIGARQLGYYLFNSIIIAEKMGCFAYLNTASVGFSCGGVVGAMAGNAIVYGATYGYELYKNRNHIIECNNAIDEDEYSINQFCSGPLCEDYVVVSKNYKNKP